MVYVYIYMCVFGVRHIRNGGAFEALMVLILVVA